MTQLNTADDLKLGVAQVLKAYMGSTQVWEQHIAPVNTVLPVVSGATTVGDTATSTTGTWAPAAASYTYQWQELISAVWTNVSGATSSTYLTTAAGTFRSRVSATNAYGSTTANSAQFAVSAGGGGTPAILGDNGSGGGGNWPTSANRALLKRVVLANTATLSQFNMRTRSAHTAGDRFKGVVYSADGTGGNPGTRRVVTAATAASAAGAQLLTVAATGVLAPGTYWVGYVCDGGSTSGGETDSGGTDTNATIMLNGIMSYAAPEDPANNWPGSPGPYSNAPALWFDYTF